MPLASEMVPVNLLLDKMRYWRFVRRDIDAGSSPSRWLVLISRDRKVVILPISNGTVPVN